MKKIRLQDIPNIEIKDNEAFIKCKSCGYFFVSTEDKEYCCFYPCMKKDKKQTKGLRLRFKIFQRDNFTCKYCGRNIRDDNIKLQVDHIKPVSKGGKYEIKNLITSCSDCNLGKNDVLLTNANLFK